MLGLMTDQEVKQTADAAYCYTLYQKSRYNIKHLFLMSSAKAPLIRPSSIAIASERAHVGEKVLTKYMDLCCLPLNTQS